MNRAMFVRLAAFVSVLLLLVVSITPVLAQTTMERIVLSAMGAGDPIQGAVVLGVEGSVLGDIETAEGRFTIGSRRSTPASASGHHLHRCCCAGGF